MNKQFYILEMNNFTEEEAQEFFNQLFSNVTWGNKQGVGLSHLTKKGVADLKKYVLKEREAE